MMAMSLLLLVIPDTFREQESTQKASSCIAAPLNKGVQGSHRAVRTVA